MGCFEKNIKIIYVESSESTRNLIQNKLSKNFKKVYALGDGNSALEFYKALKEEGLQINAIVSDFNLTNMSGLDLLKEIRKIDKKLPFFFTSEQLIDNNYLESNALKVSEYILKPIDVKYVVEKIVNECKNLKQLELIENQKKENRRYLSLLDSVANVLKTDLDGIITYVNDNFCKSIKYDKEEVIGKHYDVIKHPDTPISVYNNLRQTVQSGEIWEGILKNRAKDGSTLFVKSTIIPLYDEEDQNIIEYIGVRFVITDEVRDKREFKRKMIQNFSKEVLKRNEQDYYIKALETKLESLDIDKIKSIFENKLVNKRNKIDFLNSQILYYENKIKKINDKSKYIVNMSNEKLKLNYENLKKLRISNRKLIQDLEKVNSEIEVKNKDLKKLENKVIEQNKIINNFRDIIVFKEEELLVKNEKKERTIKDIFSNMKKT